MIRLHEDYRKHLLRGSNRNEDKKRNHNDSKGSSNDAHAIPYPDHRWYINNSGQTYHTIKVFISIPIPDSINTTTTTRNLIMNVYETISVYNRLCSNNQWRRKILI